MTDLMSRVRTHGVQSTRLDSTALSKRERSPPPQVVLRALMPCLICISFCGTKQSARHLDAESGSFERNTMQSFGESALHGTKNMLLGRLLQIISNCTHLAAKTQTKSETLVEIFFIHCIFAQSAPKLELTRLRAMRQRCLSPVLAQAPYKNAAFSALRPNPSVRDFNNECMMLLP